MGEVKIKKWTWKKLTLHKEISNPDRTTNKTHAREPIYVTNKSNMPSQIREREINALQIMWKTAQKWEHITKSRPSNPYTSQEHIKSKTKMTQTCLTYL